MVADLFSLLLMTLLNYIILLNCYKSFYSGGSYRHVRQEFVGHSRNHVEKGKGAKGANRQKGQKGKGAKGQEG